MTQVSISGIEAAFADGIRPGWAHGLQNVRLPEFDSVEHWLVNGSYTWISAAPGTTRISLPISQSDFTEALASEISRFACAAYESLMDASPSGPSSRALGWQLVRHYYAAFYNAHALLRISGVSLSYLSPSAVASLNKIGGQYLGASPQMSTGLHRIARDPANLDVIVIEKLSNGGGSHEDMWAILLGFLVSLETSMVLNQGHIAAALDAVKVSSTLRTAMCQQGKNNGAWPSMVRNAVNYRQDFGVWFPYSLKQSYCDSISLRLGRWTPTHPSGFSIDKPQGDLGTFADICTIMSRLVTAVLKDISWRAPKSRSCFVERLPFKLLRERQVSL